MISSFKKDHTAAVANIHREALATDFLPSLGLGLLKTLYDSIVEKQGIYGYVYSDKKEVQGFIIGTKNTNIFFKAAIKTNFLKVVWYVSIALLKKPSLTKDILETLLYPSKSDASSAELMVIAIHKSFQGKGVGKKLVKRFEKRLLQEGIKKYKLTVHADKKAIYFYEKLAYHRRSAFTLYSKKWYIYEKKLS